MAIYINKRAWEMVYNLEECKGMRFGSIIKKYFLNDEKLKDVYVEKALQCLENKSLEDDASKFQGKLIYWSILQKLV